MTFQLEEATIASVHGAYRDKALNAESLTQDYLNRINAYDQNGPALNAVITVNDHALETARNLDAHFARTGEFVGPLHGIPVVVKDQAETAGLMTTFGSRAMAGYIPEQDATAIAKLKQAGAIILAKTTLPDFATSWFSFSSQSGQSKNPYDLARDPGGSSSGTGAAVAANYATIGIGEDTGGSIRLPSSFNNLVGLKVTPGLISRTGMSPLVVFQDSAGPMCRTVEDVARTLDVMAGFDADDPFTATAAIAGTQDYTRYLSADALQGQTIGVIRQAFGDDSDEDAAAVNALMVQALEDLQRLGAKVIDVEIPDLDYFVDYTSLYVTHSRHDINQFLSKRNVPVKTVQEIHAAKQYHPQLDLFEALIEGPDDPTSEADYYQRYTARETFQRHLVNVMSKVGASALVYPTTQIPAPRHEDLAASKWTTLTYPTNTLIAAQSWLPAVSMPAGFTAAGVPAGLELMGLPYGEARLLGLAYAYEQGTRHRRAPASCPPL